MTRRMRIEDLTEIAVPENAVLSPDGTQIVYVVRSADAAADRNIQHLWRVGTSSGEPHQLTHGQADQAPAWSPDGTRIAFLRADDGPAQLWTVAADGGEPVRLTGLPLGAGTAVWSPDGTRLAFTAFADEAGTPDEDEAARAKRSTAPIVIDRVNYKLDGLGFVRTARRHVHIVEVASGLVRQVTRGDWHAGDPEWSPDGTLLAFPGSLGDDGGLALRAAAYVIDATDPRARPRAVGLADGAAGPLRFTADGAALLVIGYPGTPSGHASLLRVPLDGSAPVDLSAALDRNVMPGGLAYPGAHPQLVDDGATVLFCARDRGVTKLYAVDVSGGEPRLLLGGDGLVVSGVSAAAGAVVVTIGTPDSYGEVATIDLTTGEETVRTRHGDSLADVSLFPAEERQFRISDGTVVAGWVIRDPAVTGPTPLLLDIHGGPHNAWNAVASEMHPYHQELVARGWTVLIVNPRGSDGYGTDFFTGAIGNWGASEANDLLEPVDALVADGIADPARLAIAGYSYGGYMTCYLTGRDHRFAAAVAGGVVSDLVSMVGTCEDAHFFSELELGGQFWNDREAYERMSPISRVQDVRTPTLVLHGTDDLTCPVGQAEQWYLGLRERGVPTEMVLYPGGSHGFILVGPPSQRIDFGRRIVEWVERYAGHASGPRRAPLDAAHWKRRLADLAERHGVPGAQLGILRVGRDGFDDEVVTTASGVLNRTTGVEATTDSLFQIGSISKVWTATLVMQLVDDGLIDLDAPIIEILPELRLSDATVQAGVTLRHLLTHTSGIDGDLFTDTGRGDDTLEKYVALLAEVPQNHPLGATWSYCNSGFSLIGRIIEKVTGTTWDAALRERLLTPLGLDHTVTLPEEALLFSAAVGHDGKPGEPATVVPVWTLPRALGPAGLICANAADALAFARLHLTGGLAADGTRLLRADTAAAMAAHQTDLPDKHTLGDSWGLGWIRYGWDGERLIGHDGNTIGQAAFLRALPDQGLAVVLHTNGGNARDLYEELFREVFAEVAEVAMPQPFVPPVPPVAADIGAHLGTYERESVRIEVLNGEDGPLLRTVVLGPLAELVPDPVDEYALAPVAENLFAVREPEGETWMAVTFYALSTGEQYLHFGARATPKVG